MQQISVLLGAGFSVNKGYMTASQLNYRISKIQPSDFSIASEGTFIWLNSGGEDFTTNYHVEKHFLVDLIKHYCNKNEFNYEKFFDYYKNMSRSNFEDSDFVLFWKSFNSRYPQSNSVQSLLDSVDRLFQQLVSSLLIDKDLTKFYPNEHHCKPIYPGYTGFLNCLESWGENSVLHIHTLNHDLFLESLRNSDWIKNEFCDGFSELGSPFYGKNSDGNMVRLEFFSNQYNQKFRFYKLHGSTDYYPFHLQNSNTIDYIKSKKGISKTEFYKESINEKNEKVYFNDWINYHSDFLSGTTSKILRYKEPGYYKSIFDHFKRNLTESLKLVIIGYGFGDIEINNLIIKYYKEKYSIFIVEPFPHQKTIDFCKITDAKLILKNPENMNLSDFI